MLKRITEFLQGDTPATGAVPAMAGSKPGKWRLDYHNSPQAAAAAFRFFNNLMPDQDLGVLESLLARAVEFDALRWPRKIAPQVRGKDVLDVGCGNGLHAIGFAAVGVRSYVGIDPRVRLDDDHAKNQRLGSREWFGWTPRQIMTLLPHVNLISGTFEEAAVEGSFDIAVLHNVTEHLHGLEDVFGDLERLLRSDGELLFHHHNFYCWNGHHQRPKRVTEIDPTDARQVTYLDWAHLAPQATEDPELNRSVNRVRLDELRLLTERYFEIESWKESLSDEARGKGRLTPAIRARYPQYSERELVTQGVLCKARKRSAAGASVRES